MMRHVLLAAAVCGLSSHAARAQAYQPYVGEIETFAVNFCPYNWLPTSGELLSITQYNTLYNLIGTTYGGDGVTTFAAPQIAPARKGSAVNFSVCISPLGVFPSRN